MYKKIYVAASYHYQSGGTESLHQLVDKLNRSGNNAFIFYYDKNEIKNIPEKFSLYNIKITRCVEDATHNLLIVPETKTSLLYQYEAIEKSIWWLSLDYYLYQFPMQYARIICNRYNISKLFAPLISINFSKVKDKQFEFGEDKNNIIHFYNCEHVRIYLKKQGILSQNMYYLCGPLRDEYFESCNSINLKNKENIILYNPNKGYYFTNKIIKYAKKKDCSYVFIAIRNMTPEQVTDIMKRAKVYIDFGDFPGPERIPREAVMLKCNIITSFFGSATNKIDVPIPIKYKFKRKNKNIPNIYKKIVFLIENYEECINDYNIYRNKIKKQRLDIIETLSRCFGNIS